MITPLTPLSIMTKMATKVEPKKKTRADLRSEKSDCYCHNPDPYAPSSYISPKA